MPKTKAEHGRTSNTQHPESAHLVQGMDNQTPVVGPLLPANECERECTRPICEIESIPNVGVVTI